MVLGILALIMVLAMVLSLSACTALPDNKTGDQSGVPTADTPDAAGTEGQTGETQTADPQNPDNTDASQEFPAPSVYTLAIEDGCGNLDYYTTKSAPRPGQHTTPTTAATAPHRGPSHTSGA